MSQKPAPPSPSSHAAPPQNKRFQPGQFLFKEGDPSHCMFLIQKGTVSVRKSKGSAQVELARLYSNEVLGELAFFDRLPRSAAAIALTDVEVLEIQFDALDKVYHNIPDYLKAIMMCVADRLRKANDTIRRLQKEVVKDPTATGAAAGAFEQGGGSDISSIDELGEGGGSDETLPEAAGDAADALDALGSLESEVAADAEALGTLEDLGDLGEIPDDITATSPPPPRKK